MARVLITGSTDGLGRAAARKLIEEGHQVILHARSHERVSVLDDLASRSGGVVVGDLRSAAETRRLAEQVNAMGRMDAVIHNAGISSTKDRSPTPEGHASILAVNTLAPYMLTALIERPRRLVYLSSSMHRGGTSSLRDIDWNERRWNSSQAYSDSKLYLTALAFAIARRWPDVLSNAVDPGWVPTKMGGPEAPDDFDRDISLRRGSRAARILRRPSAADTGIIVERTLRRRKCLTLASKTSSRKSSSN